MPREIVIKRRTLVGALLVLAALGAFVMVQQIPDIKREIRVWTM